MGSGKWEVESGKNRTRLTTGRQPHRSRAHQRGPHNQQIRMRLLHARADLLHERQDDQRRDGMADKRRDDEDQRREDEQHAVQTHARNAVCDRARNGMQQTRGTDRSPERQAARREDDDRPEEVVEVFFREDARAEEEDQWDDGDDAHVAEDALELVADAPEHYGRERHEADEPLHAGELVFHGPDRDDCGALAWLEGYEEEEPDSEDGEDADWEGDEEPGAPAGLWVHVLEGDDVLRGGDGRGGAADVGGEGDAED